MLPSTAQVVINDKNAEEETFLPIPVKNPTAPEPAPEQTTRLYGMPLWTKIKFSV